MRGSPLGPGRRGDYRRHRTEEVHLVLGELGTPAHQISGAPARAVNGERGTCLVIDAERAPDLVQPAVADYLAVGQVRHPGHRERLARQPGESVPLSAGELGLGQPGSYSGGMRSLPLIIESITTVSGSIEAQQVNSLATACPTTSIAAE